MTSRSSQPVFLATTALEEFWDVKKPLVFLHEGCCRYSRRNVWSRYPHTVLRGPLEDREAFYAGYAYVNAAYERILERLAKTLNELHGTRHSVRFWRMTAGCWLLHYVHILYERYVTLKAAVEHYPDLTTIGLAEEDFVTPRDTKHLFNLFTADAFNLQVYTKILKFLGVKFGVQRYDGIESVVIKSRDAGLKKKVVGLLGSLVGSRARVWARELFFSSHAVEAEIFLRSGATVWFDLQDDPPMPVISTDRGMRAKVSLGTGGDEFERLVGELLPMDIPQVFVEGFRWACETSREKYPSGPRSIVSASGWYFDEVFKVWSALKAEEGTEIAAVQHGTIYGLIRCWPPEDYETKISDRFYSWGWKEDKASCEVRSMPSTKFMKAKVYGADNRKQGVLLTTNCFPRYFYRFQDFRPYDNEPYFAWQQRFIGALPASARYMTRVRLYLTDMGVDCRERWQDFDPKIKLEDWSVEFQESLENCRLHVTDHLASTFVDGFVADKPTLLFWDPKVFQVRPSAAFFFDELRRAGILYDTPEAAANALPGIYDDVEAWWNAPERQKAVKELCRRFADVGHDPVGQWFNEFQRLGRENAR